MKILFLTLITLSIYAHDILTDYRINGIEDIEKQLDQELTQKSYWDNQIKNKDTSFGYLESYSHVLSCDKNSSTLSLFKKDVNNTFVEMKSYNAFTGKADGDKKYEGDLKTPIGVYNINERLDKNTKLDPFYGPLAFVTTYPNLYDKARGKNGSGIWLHGLPINQKRDDFTRGCIAIDNKSIECLDNNINISKTVLIINPSSKKNVTSKDTLSTILSNLYEWRYAWKYSDIAKYLSFYSDDFKKTNGETFNRFKTNKEFVFQKKEDKTIIFNNINIFKYPNTDGVYQISFDEYYKTKYYKFVGNKTLMIKLDSENKIQIFLEN